MAHGRIGGVVLLAAAAGLGPLTSPLTSASAQQRTPPRGEEGPQRHEAGTRVADGLLARQSGSGGAATFAPVRFEPASAPLALRYNNYLAIKRPGRGGTLPGQIDADARGFITFDDPAYAVRAFLDLVRGYHDRGGARSAHDVFRRFAPPGDCAGAPRPRLEGGGCPENEVQAPVSAARAARAVGLGPQDDLRLFGPGGEVNHDAMRALLDAAASQEIGPPYCPQPPRGETWLGCRVDDALYQRALALLAPQTAQQPQPQGTPEQQAQPQRRMGRAPQHGGVEQQPGAQPQPSAAGAPQRRVARLIGTGLVGADGRSAGEIENLVVDGRGNVRAAVIGWGGFLGLGERRAVLAIEQVRLPRAEGERGRVTLTRAQLEELPRYDRGRLAEYGRERGWGDDVRLAR